MKTWVLAMSVDTKVERKLPRDERNLFEASLLNSDGSTCPPCLVTGYPVGLHFPLRDNFEIHSMLNVQVLDAESAKTFKRAKIPYNENLDLVARRDDWNRLLMVHKSSGDESISDVLKFIQHLTGTSISIAI